jgi:hypothetical protein
MAIGDSSAALLFRIKGDASDAVRAFQETGVAEKDLATATKETNAAMSGLETGFASTGAAVLGFTAVLGGLAVVGAGIVGTFLELARHAAEFGSKIHDAGQQTGLSAETISALKFAADESGSSLEAITGSVAKFSALLGAAKEGNEKAIATLNEYGITARTTDAALTQAIKTIADMRDHDLQAAAAKDLFRERTAAILPVIQSFDGDLPKLIAHLRDLGLIMSQEDADAADEFGDQMDTLTKQITGAKIAIGTEFMPVFLDFSKQLSDWLAKNKGEVKDWAENLAKSFHTAVLSLEQDGAELQFVADILAVLNPFNNETTDKGLTEAYRKLKERSEEIGKMRQAAQFSRTGQSGGTSYALDQNNNVITPDIEGQDARKNYTYGKTPLDAEAEKERTKALEEEAKKRRELREKEAREAIQSATESNRKFLAYQREQFQLEQEENEKRFIEGEEKANEYRDKSVENIKKYRETVTSLIQNAYAVDMAGAKNQADADAAESERKRALVALTREVNKEAADALKNIDQQRKKSEDQQKKEAEDNEKRIKEQIALDKEAGREYAEGIEKENEKTRELEKSIRDVNKVLDEEFQTLAEHNLAHVFDTEDSKSEYGPFQSLIDGWQAFVDLVNDTGPSLGDTVTAIAGLMTDAFNGFANALGNVVEQWVLTGDTGPAVMKKMLATALASLAAEAAVRALWELALGFASLFFNPAEAAAHFTAAAIFGTIAGVAAVAGRAVAGDSFKNKSGSANSRASASSGNQPDQNPPVYSRQTATANDSGTRDTDFAAAIDRHTDALVQVGGHLQRITSVPPGQVLVNGINQSPGVIGNAVNNDISRNSSIGTNILKSAGVK